MRKHLPLARQPLVLSILVMPALLMLAGLFAASVWADGTMGSTSGKIVARSETTIDVLAPDAKQPVRYLLPVDMMHDQKALAFIKSLAVGDQVALTWVDYHGHRLVNNIHINSPAAPAGKLIVGTVTDMAIAPDKMIWIELKDDAGKTERYSPTWGEGGLNKEMVAAITRRNIGDTVQIRTITDDHVRVTTMRVMSLAPEASRKPDFDGGDISGRVVSKDKDSITIKTTSGDEAHFLPQPITGTKDELDAGVVKAIAALKVGDKVEGQWYGDGQKRLIWLKLAAAPSATKAATKAADGAEQP